MAEKDTLRISRLITMVTLLQSKRLLTSTEVAKKFNVSIRTVYRDIKALEAAGVPILTEEGKGYSLQEGFSLPPIMFTEREANAFITAEKLVQLTKDTSLIRNYSEGITKIKSVLRNGAKDNAVFLSERVAIEQNPDTKSSSNFLSSIQIALTNFSVLKINYHSPGKDEVSKRYVEPFALINRIGENWYLIAWCRLRKDFRLFRFDRIRKMEISELTFSPHKITLQEYLESYRKNKFKHP